MLDFSVKHHRSIYSQATASLYADTKDRYDLDAIGAQALLQKIRDRCETVGLEIIDIPATRADLHRYNAGLKYNTIHLCDHHGQVSLEELKDYVAKFAGQPTRPAQDDFMLAQMLEASLTENVIEQITRDKDDYTVYGHRSGVMMLKLVLEESSLDSAEDPDIVRRELSHADEKFKELNYNVRELHAWVKLKVTQLGHNGEFSNDITTHLLTAYRSSPDSELTDYITVMDDYARDHNTRHTYKSLMQKVKAKYDSIETRRQFQKVGSSKPEADIGVLQALQSEVTKLRKRLDSKGSGGGNGGGNSNSNSSQRVRKPSRYPRELNDKEPPTNPSDKVKIDGQEFSYCETHKWCKHKTAECKGKARTATTLDDIDKPPMEACGQQAINALGAVAVDR